MNRTLPIIFLFLLLIPSLIYAVGQYEQPECAQLSPEDKKGGVVPCGRTCDDPFTEADETQPCTFCHFFVMINGIVSFIMFKLTPVVAVLMLVIGGVMFFFAGAKTSLLLRAKGVIWSVVIGLLIIFSAWVIVNTVLTKTGIVESPSLLNWYTIECPTP